MTVVDIILIVVCAIIGTLPCLVTACLMCSKKNDKITPEPLPVKIWVVVEQPAAEIQLGVMKMPRKPPPIFQIL